MDHYKYTEEDYFLIQMIADAVVYSSMRKQLMTTSEMITGIPAEIDKYPEAYLSVLWYLSKVYDKEYSYLSEKYSDELLGEFWSHEDDFNLNACIKGDIESNIAKVIYLKWRLILKDEIGTSSNNIKQTAV